jgi:hypothetical protein
MSISKMNFRKKIHNKAFRLYVCTVKVISPRNVRKYYNIFGPIYSTLYYVLLRYLPKLGFIQYNLLGLILGLISWDTFKASFKYCLFKSRMSQEDYVKLDTIKE